MEKDPFKEYMRESEPNEYISIHRKLFQGIYKHAGKIRDYNITKKEWVLDGATVMYGSASELRATLEYDFSQEKDFSYKGLSMDEIIHHLAVFVSRLWQKGIHETTEYLEMFLGNLLLNEQNELKNRNLHINGLLNEEKVDIESMISAKDNEFSVKTMVHIHRLFDGFGFDGIFGRSAVMELLELKSSGASKLLSNLVQADIIEPVSGHGKGKYKFKK